MLPTEPSSASMSRRGPRCLGSDPLRTIVWLRGDHDIANRSDLSGTIAQAVRLDDADIVVDLSGVTFMDASTIGALVAARNHLRPPSRSLSVCAPSPRSRRLLDLCGLAQLIDEQPATAPPPVVTALGSWVDVPARDNGTDSSQPSAAHDHTQEPARAFVRRRVAPAASARHGRVPT